VRSTAITGAKRADEVEQLVWSSISGSGIASPAIRAMP
jgi:hypothetical protein